MVFSRPSVPTLKLVHPNVNVANVARMVIFRFKFRFIHAFVKKKIKIYLKFMNLDSKIGFAIFGFHSSFFFYI